jgi:hypothetical protein
VERNATGVARVCLAKEASSPEIYLAYGDTKFHIPSPPRMDAMGLRWDKVEVCPDGSLADLARVELGTGGTRPSQVYFDRADEDSPPVPGNMSKLPAAVVRHDVLVAGTITRPFWNAPYDGEAHSQQEGPWVEDILWTLVLDVDFIERMYGPEGLSTALVNATLPGHVSPPSGSPGTGGVGQLPSRLPFGDLPPDGGGRRYATVGAFSAPDHNYLHLELNCWHVNEHVGNMRTPFPPEFYVASGRGQPPGGWVKVYDSRPCTFGAWHGILDDCWWPWDPSHPDGWPGAIWDGDTVMVCGTLWQDTAHESAMGAVNAWARDVPGQGGWLEMHPPDWIHRFHVDAPTRTYAAIALPDPGNDKARSASGHLPVPPNRAGKIRQVAGQPTVGVNHRYDSFFDGGNCVDHVSVTVAGDYSNASYDAALKPAAGSSLTMFAGSVIADWIFVDKPKEKDTKDKEVGKDTKEHGKEANLAIEKSTDDLQPDASPLLIGYPPHEIPDAPGATTAADPAVAPKATFIAPAERPSLGP